ncbi:uncharacterized protein K452DRAFT_281038 [Aplosporella prunicola CBS 121167]|uniref:Uncharacterized protein n=1 Tax=Aplosporella prunicola CBS 121167 TaxID=1176127 RepID=A0A6A6AWX3_9PEZI|nr:uncharacterized protein K452DRAFT_281038 [Aplosporella prunicola CBS 121167]KAF2135768.1 hypothetical protein K452DRAFT_281038 [Aplosporella prunicola CBS 121167]
MTEVGGIQYGFSGQSRLVWKEGTLRDLISSHFGNTQSLAKEHVKLEKVFNARNLVRMAGLEVVWTHNLADHLRLYNDDKSVAIFHHVTFLKYQRHDIFPRGFVDETLRTLALLLPSNDRDTQTWFRQQQSFCNLDVQANKCTRLRADDRRIDNFAFWRDRLVILKQVFDEAEPSTLSQWWYDRRNGPQWYTFWVAVAVLLLTIFFGLVQSIEGALQVYKAYHPDSD